MHIHLSGFIFAYSIFHVNINDFMCLYQFYYFATIVRSQQHNETCAHTLRNCASIRALSETRFGFSISESILKSRDMATIPPTTNVEYIHPLSLCFAHLILASGSVCCFCLFETRRCNKTLENPP